MIKEIYIRPITKLEPQVVYKGRSVFMDNWNTRYIDLWFAFWKWLLDSSSEYSKHDIFTITKNNSLNNNISEAIKLFAYSEKKLPSSLELVFIYTIFNSVVNNFNSIYNDRKLSLWESLSHISSWFNPNTINTLVLKEFNNNNNDIVGDFLVDIFNKSLPDNKCICIFEFFWPSELIQILLLAKHAKRLWHTVILSSTKSNEQTDFTRWIDAFLNNQFIFDYIDYYIPHSDYWKSLWILKKYLDKIDNIKEENLENIVYKNNNKIIYIEPNKTSEDELFLNFTRSFYKANFKLINWKKSVALRFMPYKCYWSWCYFCTINSSHLYSYKKNEIYIHTLLDYIEKNSIELINFVDEAIHPDDIILFAKEIIKRKLKIIYRIRARFDRKYTNEICKLFYKSWMRYCGIGLECYSDRINSIINKWDILIKEKKQIINAFNSAWIPFHNYAIIWLPQETAEEMFQTYNFLKDNIENSDNYNCSPNSFWLNRWSYFAKNAESFWLLINKEESNFSNSLELRIDFKKDSRLILLQKKIASDLHTKQFLPFYKKNRFEFIDPELFWVFIDRSGIFYYMKLFAKISPFRSTYNYLNWLSKYDTFLENKYKLFRYIEIYPSWNKYNEWFNYWSWASVLLPKNFTKDDYFLYDNKKTLKDNILNNSAWSKLYEDKIVSLIKWLFLII